MLHHVKAWHHYLTKHLVYLEQAHAKASESSRVHNKQHHVLESPHSLPRLAKCRGRIYAASATQNPAHAKLPNELEFVHQPRLLSSWPGPPHATVAVLRHAPSMLLHEQHRGHS
eukprot:TRINITY_DN83452_c0_g1_i1.p1 TRINITY_DN83452_c0_g1~~TRINITY_DN83452_c0_g1_i1.p1  ORF type:complete len:114 (+),score=12.87 TRINITY_DN83452_c0_g1_i1:132-473(+)